MLLKMYHKTGIALGEVDGGRVEVGTFECSVGHNTCRQSHRALDELLVGAIPAV